MKNVLSNREVAEAGYTANIALIQQAFASDDPTIRATSLGSFHRLGKLDSTRILLSLRDSDPIVRRRAAELAPRLALTGATTEPIAQALGHCLDEENEVAEMAAFALGELGSVLEPSIIVRLENQALNHPDALCREQAVASLGALHSSPEVILRALDDKATVRRRAVIALAPFEGPEIEAALQRALADRDWQVRQAAEDLLGPPSAP